MANNIVIDSITNYFDELINQVDLDIEEALKNCNDKSTNCNDKSTLQKQKEVMTNLQCFKLEQRPMITQSILSLFKPHRNMEIETPTVNLSTKLVDYLNQVRVRTIKELRLAKEESLLYYAGRFNYSKEINYNEKIEELKSQLFAKKFCFQVRLTNKDYKPLIFKTITFVTDFYMSSTDINILK